MFVRWKHNEISIPTVNTIIYRPLKQKDFNDNLFLCSMPTRKYRNCKYKACKNCVKRIKCYIFMYTNSDLILIFHNSTFSVPAREEKNKSPAKFYFFNNYYDTLLRCDNILQ